MASNGGLDHLHHAKGIHGWLRAVRSPALLTFSSGSDSTSNLNELPISLRGDLARWQCGTVAATVFKEQDTAAWAADAAHFAQRLDGIGKCACAESGHDRVE